MASNEIRADRRDCFGIFRVFFPITLLCRFELTRCSFHGAVEIGSKLADAKLLALGKAYVVLGVSFRKQQIVSFRCHGGLHNVGWWLLRFDDFDCCSHRLLTGQVEMDLFLTKVHTRCMSSLLNASDSRFSLFERPNVSTRSVWTTETTRVVVYQGMNNVRCLGCYFVLAFSAQRLASIQMLLSRC